jgi:hypothetical protein
MTNSRYRTTPWPESASELYRLSDHRLLAKLVQTFADRGWHVDSVTDPYGRILGFLDRSRYFFFQVAPQLYSRVWVDPVPDPLLLIKSGSAGNRTRAYGSVTRNPWPLDHRSGHIKFKPWSPKCLVSKLSVKSSKNPAMSIPSMRALHWSWLIGRVPYQAKGFSVL